MFLLLPTDEAFFNFFGGPDKNRPEGGSPRADEGVQGVVVRAPDAADDVAGARGGVVEVEHGRGDDDKGGGNGGSGGGGGGEVQKTANRAVLLSSSLQSVMGVVQQHTCLPPPLMCYHHQKYVYHSPPKRICKRSQPPLKNLE